MPYSIPSTYNYMTPSVPHVVNGLSEPTSQHVLDVCTPFPVKLPAKAPFKPQDIVIVGNGQCASTCAQFTTVMHERHGTRMVVFGGKPGEPLEYKGTPFFLSHRRVSQRLKYNGCDRYGW